MFAQHPHVLTGFTLEKWNSSRNSQVRLMSEEKQALRLISVLLFFKCFELVLIIGQTVHNTVFKNCQQLHQKSINSKAAITTLNVPTEQKTYFLFEVCCILI